MAATQRIPVPKDTSLVTVTLKTLVNGCVTAAPLVGRAFQLGFVSPFCPPAASPPVVFSFAPGNAAAVNIALRRSVATQAASATGIVSFDSGAPNVNLALQA